MTSMEAEDYIKKNCDFFEKENLQSIKSALIKSGQSPSTINSIKLKSPKTGLILSILLGLIGIDRFYAKSYIAGIIKLLTGGCYGIWWIIDWFIIKKCIRNNNYITLFLSLGFSPKCSKANIFARGIVDGLKSERGKELINEVRKSSRNLADSFDINK